MSNALAVIQERLSSKEVTNRLAVSLGLSPDDEKAQTQAFKYASSVIAEIAKTQGNEKNDLTKCTPDSICRAVVDAAQFRISVDGRKLAYLEARWNKDKKALEAGLQISTNGLVYKIAEQYPDVTIQADAVFEGDTLKIKVVDGVKDYDLIVDNPFCTDIAKLQGVVVKLSYTMSGKKHQDVQVVPKQDLLKMKAASKTSVWDSWPIERMKTAAIKRVCKWHFKAVIGLQDMIDYDNRENYDLAKIEHASPVRKNIVDNLSAAIEGKPIVEDEPMMVEHVEEAAVVAEPEPEIIAQPEPEIVVTDYALTKKAGTSYYPDVAQWEAANRDVLKGLKSLDHFAKFMQINYDHWTKVREKHPDVLNALDNYVSVLQQKIQGA